MIINNFATSSKITVFKILRLIFDCKSCSEPCQRRHKQQRELTLYCYESSTKRRDIKHFVNAKTKNRLSSTLQSGEHKFNSNAAPCCRALKKSNRRNVPCLVAELQSSKKCTVPAMLATPRRITMEVLRLAHTVGLPISKGKRPSSQGENLSCLERHLRLWASH